MKLTVILLLGSLVAMSATTYSQNTKLSVSSKNATLIDIFRNIEDQSEFYFYFNKEEVKSKENVSVEMKDAQISDILDKVLSNTGLEYKIIDRYVVVKEKGSPDPAIATQTNRKVTGKVTDSSGATLPGVSVVVKGSTNGTITDGEGNYSLANVPESAIVQFSFVGMKMQEIAVGGKTSINVTLAEDAIGIDEVVAVGYGTQSKRNVTGAISNINSDAIVRSNTTLLSNALAGKILGVTTRATDARPGKAVNLQIRNMGNPLYVIDGIPYGGSTALSNTTAPVYGGVTLFNQLSIDDIESISILKDGSAAVYGLRASNGVVLVTTKKGLQNEDVRVNINGYYGWQNFTRYPTPANAGQYVRGIVESEQNQGRDPSKLFTPEELAKWEAGKEQDYKGYNWLDIVSRRDVPQYNINANITGGSKKVNYYLSLTRLDQSSIIKDNKWNKTNVQSNIETRLMDGLTIGTQISGIIDNTYTVAVPGWDRYGRPMNSIMRMWPIEGPFANDNENYLNNTHILDHNAGFYNRKVGGYADGFQKNANVNLYASYDFKFGLSAKATYSYNFNNLRYDAKNLQVPSYRYNKVTDTYEKQTNIVTQFAAYENRNVAATYAQFQLNYKHSFGDHDVKAMLASERSSYDNSYYLQTANPSSNYISLFSFSELNNLWNTWDYEARAGYIGRLNYNYKGKYLVELLGRYDGSYLYARENRWGFFPGVSLGWRFSDESFFKGIANIVNDAKIRFSYGETGSESGVAMFGYMPGYNFGQRSSILDGITVIGIAPRGLPVTHLSWITNTSTNIGIDLAFFDRKLTATAEIFQRKRTGIPDARYDVVLPNEVGYSLPNENLNSDVIKGIEGIVTYTGKASDLNYSLSANASFSRLRSLETYKPRFSNSWQKYTNSIEDRWLGTTWGYHVIGQFGAVDEINNYPVNNDGQGNRTMLPGDLIYEDINGDRIINSLDQRPIGYAQGATPYLTFGLNTNLDWKRISLSLDFVGGAMQSLYRSDALRVPYNSDNNSPAYMLSDRWHQESPYDNNSSWIAGKYPAIRKGYNSHSNYWNSDFWLTNIHYLRLKNVQIGYALPKNIISKLKASELRVYVNVSNLFSLDNVSKYQIDPEIATGSGMVYPSQRVVMLGFNLSL